MIVRLGCFYIIAIILNASPAFGRPSENKCSGADMKEAMHFLSDYLTCVAGDAETCKLMTESMQEGLRATAQIAGYDRVRNYTAKKLLRYSELALLNAKKVSNASGYSKSIQQQWGGKNVDRYILENGGDLEKALEKNGAAFDRVQTELKAATVDRQRVALKSDLIETNQMREHLMFRKSMTDQNASLLKKTMTEVATTNKDIFAQVDKLDRQLAEMESELLERTSATNPNAWTAKKELEAERKNLFKRMVRLESTERNFVTAYNETLSAMIQERQTRIASETDLFVRKRLQDTVAFLENEKLKFKPGSTTATPRLAVGMRDGNILGADLTAPDKPKWAREAGIEAQSKFPKIVKSTIEKNPDLLNDFEKLKEALSEAEHERWRSWRQQDLIDQYENRRMKRPEYKDMKFPLDKDGKLVPGANLTQEQRQALDVIKPDWTSGDVSWSQLDKQYKLKTVSQIEKELEKFAFWDEAGRMRPLTRFFAARPTLARFVGKAIHVGPGLGLELGMLYFDRNNLREMAFELAMSTDPRVSEFLWSRIKPRCRRPDDADLKTETNPGEYAPWLCQCKEDKTKSVDSDSRCLRPLSEMSEEEKDICHILKADGRNQNLLAAQKYKELQSKNSSSKDMLREGLSCDVMKNYPSHCNWATDDLTDQGIYYMTIIKNEDLYKPVAELCPGVCEHWMEVASRKAEELFRLGELLKLPQSEAENNPPAACKTDCGADKCNPDGTPVGPPPQQGQERLQWETCQKVITCSKNQISVKPRIENRSRILEKYNISLDPEKGTVRDVTLVTSTKAPSAGQTYTDRVGFHYRYDQDGELNRIDVYDTREGKLRESIEVGDIISKHKEEAYNATSNLVSTAEIPRRTLGIKLRKPKTYTEEVLGRRIEVSAIVEQAMEYCCKEGTCGNSNATPSSLDEPAVSK